MGIMGYSLLWVMQVLEYQGILFNDSYTAIRFYLRLHVRVPVRDPSQAWKRHGSKLNAVAAKLREIRAQAPALLAG